MRSKKSSLLALEAVGCSRARVERLRPSAGSIVSSSVRSGRAVRIANSLIARTASIPSSRPPPW